VGRLGTITHALVGLCLVVLALAGCGSSTRTVTQTVASSSTAATTAATMPKVVLGSKSFVSRGEGWGSAEPSRIYNGGDPSGLVSGIHWTGWGQSSAHGTGRTSIFKPGGGYYRGLVRVTLRAYDIGTCTRGGPRAYLKLSTRVPKSPGGPLGPWSSWSEASNLCSYESQASTGETGSTSTTTSTPSQHAQTFHGNGVENLGTISVAVPSRLEWSCPECSIFSVTGSSEGSAVIALDSQKHTTGVTAVEPGSYHSVSVQAYSEGGAAGEWTITITPGQ
jgi:hypothetical protein